MASLKWSCHNFFAVFCTSPRVEFPLLQTAGKKDWALVLNQAQHELQEASCCFGDEFGPVNVTLAHSEHKMPFLKISIDFYDK